MPDDSAIAASFDQESAQLDDNTGMLPLLTDDRMLFSRRFKQTGDISDISKAISVENRLVARTPKGTHNLPGRLANLRLLLISLQSKNWVPRLHLSPAGLPHIPQYFRTIQIAPCLTPEIFVSKDGYPQDDLTSVLSCYRLIKDLTFFRL